VVLRKYVSVSLNPQMSAQIPFIIEPIIYYLHL